MTPFYWIIGLFAIATLIWLANRANGRHGSRKHRGRADRDMADENYRLRHVLAQLAVENHELKNSPSRYW